MDAAPRSLDVVFLLRFLGYVRLFDSVIRALLERGHRIHLLYEREIWTDRELAWLRELEQHPRFTAELTDALRRDAWFRPGDYLRRIADFVYYLGPEFRGMESLVAKAEDRVDPRLRRLLRSRLLRGGRTRRALLRALDALEAAIPSSRTAAEKLLSHDPDVLVMVPHLMPGNRHSEWVKAARAAGVPTCMCIASWDNLTSKQQLREAPDRLVVWNATQLREAVDLHRIPPERIVVTGAQSFDEWFARRPRPRDEFCARVGLDPARPYVLYLGGALFRGELTEAEFVRDVWLPQLRADPALAETGVLVRPHPRRQPEWDGVDLDAAVWPRTGNAMPVDEESRADFFDSIHHSAAVVGLNTTAMIEAAIVGRPVLTVLVPEFEESQTGTRHFGYLLTVGGGLVRTADSLERHRRQLAETLAGADADADGRRERFLSEFVRPHGLDQPALPRVVAAIEETAAFGPAAGRLDPRLLPLRLVLSLGLGGARAAVRARRLLAR